MINRIESWLNRTQAAGLPGLADADLQIATAALLSEIAESDSHFSVEEKGAIAEILQKHFDLSAQETHELMRAADKKLGETVDHYSFAAIIRDRCDMPQKIAVMEMIWRVVYTDGRLDGHEDYLAHRFATLLRLDHRQMIDAKLRVKRELGVD